MGEGQRQQFLEESEGPSHVVKLLFPPPTSQNVQKMQKQLQRKRGGIHLCSTHTWFAYSEIIKSREFFLPYFDRIRSMWNTHPPIVLTFDQRERESEREKNSIFSLSLQHEYIDCKICSSDHMWKCAVYKIKILMDLHAMWSVAWQWPP